MKYKVTAYVYDVTEKIYETEISVRRDAKMKNVFIKCMNAIGWKLVEEKQISSEATYQCDLPNIWTNGYIGAAWFIDPFIQVTIQEETGAWLAL